MWIHTFRLGLMAIVVNTNNNGAERQNKDLKHEYLKRFQDSSLSGMITVLVECFLPDQFRRCANPTFVPKILKKKNFREFCKKITKF